MKEQDIRNRDTFARYLELVQEDVARYFADPGQFTKVKTARLVVVEPMPLNSGRSDSNM